jgi:hypothetical protein
MGQAGKALRILIVLGFQRCASLFKEHLEYPRAIVYQTQVSENSLLPSRLLATPFALCPSMPPISLLVYSSLIHSLQVRPRFSQGDVSRDYQTRPNLGDRRSIMAYQHCVWLAQATTPATGPAIDLAPLPCFDMPALTFHDQPKLLSIPEGAKLSELLHCDPEQII